MRKHKVKDILYIDLNNQYYGYECRVKEINTIKGKGTKYLVEFKMESMLRACEGQIETATFELEQHYLKTSRDNLTKYSSGRKVNLPLIRIREYQCEKYNPSNKQEREYYIKDWYSYTEKFKIVDGFSGTSRPTIPRQTLPYGLVELDDSLICYFNHCYMDNKVIFHSTEIIEY